MVRSLCALFAFACVSAAAVAHAAPTKAPKVQKYDFDDDIVEGHELTRPDSPIDAFTHGCPGRLIKPRLNFVAELIKSADAL